MPIYTKTVEQVDGSNFGWTDRIIAGLQSKVATNGSTGPIASAAVSNRGSYASIPTLGASGNGSGAVLVPHMRALAAAIVGGGSGYAVNDTITLTGGTFSAAAVLTVTAVNAGVITAVNITTVGSYTVLPANPVAQGSTSGSGTGATFNITAWGLDTISVSSGGSGYDAGTQLTVTGGGGAGGGTGVITLGTTTGNPAIIPVSFSAELPANYSVNVNPGQDCRWYVAQNSKTNKGFTVTLMPPTNTATVAAGFIDVLVVG